MVTNNYFRKRYQEFVENVPGGYFVYTADEKEMIIAANTECLKIFQCETLEEFMHLVKGSFKNLVYEEDYVQATNRINMQIHQDATGYDHVVYRIVRSDGAIRWIDDYGHLVNDAKYGKVFHVFISDITDEVNNFDWMNKNHLLAFINEGIPGGYYKCYTEEGYPFEFLSRKFLEMLGYNRAEIHSLFQNKYLYLVHPEDRGKVIDYANELLENPGVNLVSDEYRVCGKNGYVWVVESAQALVSGNTMLFQGIIIDVSRQRDLYVSNQILEEKIETMDVFKTLADDYFDAHFVDGETGIAMAYRLDEWEKSVWNIQVGEKYPYQTMMETFISEVVVGEYKSELREYVDYKAVMNQLEEVYPLPIIKQFKCKRVDDELYFQIKISASYKDGKMVGFVIGFMDCDRVVRDERKKKKMLSDTLLQTQQQLKVIGGLCKEYDSVYYVDVEQDIAIPYVRPETIEKAFPMKDSFRNLYENYVNNAVVAEDRLYMLEMGKYDVVQKELETKEAYELKYHTTHLGKKQHFQLRIMCVGEAYEQVWAFRNIETIVQEHIRQENKLQTALKKAKSAENAKTSFLFNMSHDIRTPMNAVLGYASMAERHIDNKERVRDCLKKLQIAGEQLLGLISSVLDMSKIESGEMELTERLNHIPTVVKEVETIFALEMKKKNIEFSVVCDVKDEDVFMDEVKMIQIETNLIGNALKYTEPGGKVEYSVRQISEIEDGYVTFEARVKDTGRGIGKEFAKKLFEPFQRERNSTVAKVEGTGLGLAITKNLIEMMNGTIVCNSEVGVGTEFIYTVKLRAAEINVKQSMIAMEEETLDLNGFRVLLVEDNELNREIAEELLEEAGCVVEVAEDGAVAVHMVSTNEAGYYDVVLMDIQMPIMNGYEATKAIRQLPNRELADIPIIAMTANAFEDDKKQALQVGMNEHISKPIDIDKMLKTMWYVIRDYKGSGK